MSETEKPWSLKNKIIIKTVNEVFKKELATMAASMDVSLSNLIKTTMARELTIWKNSKK